ncbi:MAG TPA: hypothetical protein VJI32_01905, partial [Candidatus Nanoarchaeia archaeon]|nr:hypothetical protein [Candidatus Nanoarchaeia archaeon]
SSSQPTPDTEPVPVPTNLIDTVDSPSMGSESSSSDYSSSGTSCPPDTLLQEGACVSLPPPTEQVPLEVLEGKFPEDNVFPTALPVIFSVQDPFQQGLNCVVPSGESVHDIQQNVLQRAMEAIARGVTTILYEVDENHLQFFFILFEEPGEICVTIDVRCPLPDEQRFWQFQDVFSPTSSYFNDQYCIPTDGQPLFVAQDFTMCETLYNQIEECDIRISTDVID